MGGRFVHGREGLVGERPADEIGVHAVRGGDNVGEHTIIFTHARRDAGTGPQGPQPRQLRPRGLLAAKFLANQGRPAATRWTTCWGSDRVRSAA